jgi:hypothetical protein
MNSHIKSQYLETLKEKQKVQQWQLTAKQLVHTIYKNKTLKEETVYKCRLSKQHEETIVHLTSAIPIFGKE